MSNGRSIGSKIREALLLLALASCPLWGRVPADSTVQLPDSARWIGAEEIALALFAYTLVPVWLAIGAASLVSPTVSLESSQQRWRWGYSLGAGIGWSGNPGPLRFSRLRLQGEAGGGRMSTTLLADWNALPIGTGELFCLGASGGIGWQYSSGSERPFAHVELWLRNAMGIWYLGLFPQHSLGLRCRYFPAHRGQPSKWQLGFGWWATFVW